MIDDVFLVYDLLFYLYIIGVLIVMFLVDLCFRALIYLILLVDGLPSLLFYIQVFLHQFASGSPESRLPRQFLGYLRIQLHGRRRTGHGSFCTPEPRSLPGPKTAQPGDAGF